MVTYLSSHLQACHTTQRETDKLRASPKFAGEQLPVSALALSSLLHSLDSDAVVTQASMGARSPSGANP